jgi:hypothetical protein
MCKITCHLKKMHYTDEIQDVQLEAEHRYREAEALHTTST